jgi:hypothetical protein
MLIREAEALVHHFYLGAQLLDEHKRVLGTR